MFYTKSKSLIFYAFDLEKQHDLWAGVQNVAFQAWGMSDTDKHTPLNLGILYLDNSAKRRWVLRFDNPDVLERIDAVFVTVEPTGREFEAERPPTAVCIPGSSAESSLRRKVSWDSRARVACKSGNSFVTSM